MPALPVFSRRQLLRSLGALVLAGTCLHAFAADAPAPLSVTMQTNMGDFVIELNHDKAPKTVDNFLAYVKSGFYNGLLMHRVAKGQLIQGGGFDQKLQPRPTRPWLKNEANNGLSNTAMTIAMARGANPDSATSQFFINISDNTQLDYPSFDGAGYCVFGKVVSGTEALARMQQVGVTQQPMFDALPTTPIVIVKAFINK
jgi:peptidyl-prolyl cis-trans isomerase A (cyclophilin A)/peptidyl-prolyl cis-trans isomerase B (cyclophilin B)